MRFVGLFGLSLGALLGQVVPGRYVVELSGEPAAVSASKLGPRAALTPGFASRRTAVRQGQLTSERAITNLGGTVLDHLDTVANALIVRIPEAQADQLKSIPGVVAVHAVRRVRPFLSHALPIHKVPEAWNALPQGQNSAGAGIKIGMIDTGIDVNNPAFSDSLPALDGFPKVLASSDKQFTNAKIIVAKNFTVLLSDGGEPDANDRDGHGTGTALAAAGGSTNSPYGPLSGVAPKAYLGNYKVLDANGGTSDVIAKAIDDAVADGMDVINISLGSYVTSYADIDPSEIGTAAIEAATKAGVIVAVAGGNDGPGSGTIGDYASAPDAITVGAITNDRALGYAVLIGGVTPFEGYPGNGPDPGQAITGPLFDVANVDPTGQACSQLAANSVSGAVALVLRGSCTFESKINNVAAAGAIAALIYDNSATELFSLGSTSVGAATLPAMFVNIAQGTDLKARADASSVQVTLDFGGTTAFPTRTDLTIFSSRGPSVGSSIKPDLLAVGEEIVTGAQSSFSSGASYDPSGFIDTAGTSFSAPLVAGAAAVLKAARPGLTMQQYRSLLINSASPATAGPSLAATVQQAGAGLLNLAAADRGTVAAYPTALNFGTGPGSVSSTLDLTLSNVGAGADTYSITVRPTGGSPAPTLSNSTLSLGLQGSQKIGVSLNASGLAPGEYQGYIQISGTANPSVATIPYWFAVPGSDPAGISILYSDNSDPALSTSTEAVVIRVTDVAGLPYTGSLKPSINISAGGGAIRRFYSRGDIPGTYAADIRTGTTSMQITFSIGNVTNSVIIPVI